MIHVKIHNTIVDIIEKIESQKKGDIVLDFPLGHPILHNYISLKILKSKVGNRKLIIATNDRIGKKIGKQLGIEYSAVKDKKFYDAGTQGSLMQHNFTFWEYFKFQIRSYISELQSIIHSNKKLNSLAKYSQKYNESSSTYIFIGGLIFSIILFMFIYYFAISKTYIYITPEIVVKKEAHNFIFLENTENSILGNNKNIKINRFIQDISLQERYSSTAVKSNLQDRSRGKIRVYNMGKDPVSLVPNTRFQTNDGLVFETLSWIQIPGAMTDNFGNNSPGTIEAIIQAKLKDSEGNFIGTRGDISNDTNLIIPGLPQELQTQIYGKTIEEFQGGVSDFQKMVSQEDIDNAKSLFEQKLKDTAIKKLKNTVSLENNKNNTQIDILSGPSSIQYSNPKINLEDGIEPGALVDSFIISGSISISSYTYNKESIIQKLKTLVNEKKMEGIEKISHIDLSSLRMSEVLYTQESPFEMKATFEIESLFLHDFLNTENTYVGLLRSKIRGLEKSEAEKILLNDPRISNVEIKIRPFFVSSVSNIYNNIIFKVKK